MRLLLKNYCYSEMYLTRYTALYTYLVNGIYYVHYNTKNGEYNMPVEQWNDLVKRDIWDHEPYNINAFNQVEHKEMK